MLVFYAAGPAVSAKEEPHKNAAQATQLSKGERFEATKKFGDWYEGTSTHYSRPFHIHQSDLVKTRPTVKEWWKSQITHPNSLPLEVARTYLGVPYEWGGMGLGDDRKIDCSGLVHMAYRHTGHQGMPRDADQQEAFIIEYGEVVEGTYLLPGDLKTYGPPDKATHIAFYTGKGRILHAASRNDIGRGSVSKVIEEYLPPSMNGLHRYALRLP